MGQKLFALSYQLLARQFVALMVLCVLFVPAASAQVDTMPEPGYYVAVNEFYAGEYRQAERAFRRLTRSGVQAAQARWVDSICYHAMLGEVLYQQGRNGEALASFDQACLLLLTYPDFMRRAQFEDPRPEANPQRAVPPWGMGTRRIALGDYPRAVQVMVGNLTGAQQALQQGGTFLQAQFWRLNIAEVVRASALAMRRRNEMLGPLGKHDRISKELATAMARRNLTVSNHWSQAWTELLAGIAKAGVGDTAEAATRLDRALIVAGTFDHPLTGVALLEQGKLALAAGDHRAAGQLFLNASVSGYAYDDLNVVTDALRLGWVNFLASGGNGLYAPLQPAATWAVGNRLWHVAVTLRLAQAENVLRGGPVAEAGAIVDDVGRRLGEMRGSRLALQQMFLQAVVQVAKGQVEPGGATLAKALAGQREASLRNFQIARATELLAAGEMTPRVAPDVYLPLLKDPSAADWMERTFDTLAVISTPHGPAFERWFLAAVERKDAAAALEVAERAKRERFLSGLPLGGRMLALRGVLEAPAAELTQAALLERQQLVANFPEYGGLSKAAAALWQQLRGGSLKPEAGAAGQALASKLDAWQKNAAAREQLLMGMSLAPVPSSMLFPPLRTTKELKESLAPGQGLVVFHAAGGNLFGFLVSRQTEHMWLVGETAEVQRAAADWLRLLGNYSASREMAGEDLLSDDWRAASERMYQALFANARLDVARTTDLAIVPDSWLWYLPFEALVPSGGGGAAGGGGARPGAKSATKKDPQAGAMLVERMPLHYGPTAALTVGDRRAFRPVKHTGIVANTLAAAEAKSGGESTSLADFESGVKGPLRLVPPMAQPGFVMAPLLDQVVVLDDVDVNRTEALAWSPLPKSRGRSADSLGAWMGLPFEGPERLVITGLPTAAESALKVSRRGEGAALPGNELFLSACALEASGARTVLMSRWRTGGQMNLQLVREFVMELQTDAQAQADVAWQRSVLIARETPLDPAQEPRLKRMEEGAEPPGADHPFFWAGYMLIDTGTRVGEEGDAGQVDVGVGNAGEVKRDAAGGAGDVAKPQAAGGAGDGKGAEMKAEGVGPVLPPQGELGPRVEKPAPEADAKPSFEAVPPEAADEK